MGASERWVCGRRGSRTCPCKFCERRRMNSTGHNNEPEKRTQLEIEQEEENRKIRRLQLMMNMVMSVLAQDLFFNQKPAYEMIANAKAAALAMFPDKELAYD